MLNSWYLGKYREDEVPARQNTARLSAVIGTTTALSGLLPATNYSVQVQGQHYQSPSHRQQQRPALPVSSLSPTEVDAMKIFYCVNQETNYF